MFFAKAKTHRPSYFIGGEFNAKCEYKIYAVKFDLKTPLRVMLSDSRSKEGQIIGAAENRGGLGHNWRGRPPVPKILQASACEILMQNPKLR
jgi:hypothetical protein